MADTPKKWNGWGTAMIISFAAAILGPVIGIFGTVFGMVGGFYELESKGMGDPAELSEDISTAILSTMVGLVVVPLGLILGIVFLVLFLKKKKQDFEANS